MVGADLSLRTVFSRSFRTIKRGGMPRADSSRPHSSNELLRKRRQDDGSELHRAVVALQNEWPRLAFIRVGPRWR